MHIQRSILALFVLLLFCETRGSQDPQPNGPLLFKSVPQEVSGHIASYLRPKDLENMSKTSRYIEGIAVEDASKRYIQCLIEDKPIPREITDILNCMPKDKTEKVKQDILNLLKEKGLLVRSVPLPQFLAQKSNASAVQELKDTYAAPMLRMEWFTNEEAAKRFLEAVLGLYVYCFFDKKVSDEMIKEKIQETLKAYLPFGVALSMDSSKNLPTDVSHIVLNIEDFATQKESLGGFLAKHRHIRLILDWGQKTQIPNQFTLPESVQHLIVTGPNLQSVGDRFLDDNRTIKTIHFSTPRLTTAGICFASCCTSLEHLSLPSLTKAGPSFASGCTSLKSLSLPSLTKAGPSFAFACISLKRLSLPALTTAGSCFAYVCISLKRLSLPALTTAGSCFASGCTSLKSISAPVLTTAGDYFASGCTSLKIITVPKLTTAGHSFASGCTLVSLSLPSLTKAECSFAEGCTSLVSLSLPALETEKSSFASGRTSRKTSSPPCCQIQ